MAGSLTGLDYPGIWLEVFDSSGSNMIGIFNSGIAKSAAFNGTYGGISYSTTNTFGFKLTKTTNTLGVNLTGYLNGASYFTNVARTTSACTMTSSCTTYPNTLKYYSVQGSTLVLSVNATTYNTAYKLYYANLTWNWTTEYGVYCPVNIKSASRTSQVFCTSNDIAATHATLGTLSSHIDSNGASYWGQAHVGLIAVPVNAKEDNILLQNDGRWVCDGLYEAAKPSDEKLPFCATTTYGSLLKNKRYQNVTSASSLGYNTSNINGLSLTERNAAPAAVASSTTYLTNSYINSVLGDSNSLSYLYASGTFARNLFTLGYLHRIQLRSTKGTILNFNLRLPTATSITEVSDIAEAWTATVDITKFQGNDILAVSGVINGITSADNVIIGYNIKNKTLITAAGGSVDFSEIKKFINTYGIAIASDKVTLV